MHSVSMVLSKLMRPQSIAVVGASPRSFIGQVAMHNCATLGYQGRVSPISPTHSSVNDVATVSSLAELTYVPDVALIQVATRRVLPIVEAGLRGGIKGFVIPGGGYADSGNEALTLAKGLAALRDQYEFDVIGPNCMGIVDLHSGAAPYVGTVTPNVRRGSVGVLAQSGAIVEAFIGSAGRVAISTAVSSGSEIVTTSADYLNFFADDDRTTAVLAFIETVADADATLAAVRRCVSAGKPLAVCIVGHSEAGSSGVQAHSGKLASGARVTTAAFEQAGALVAADLDELMAFGELFSVRRVAPAGTRTQIVTNSGGEANMLADIADEVGLELPPLSGELTSALKERWPLLGVRNPLDPWGADDYAQIYPTAIDGICSEPGDIVIVAMDQHRGSGDHERRLGRDLARYLHESESPKTKFPVLLSPVSEEVDPDLVTYCREARIPLLRGARPALSALAKFARENPATPAGAADPSDVSGATLDAGELERLARSEDGALALLSSLDVRTPRRIEVDTPAAAAAAAKQIAGAVVLKGAAPGVIHKTERGLVVLAPVDIERAARHMQARNPDLALSFLVVEQIRGELEIIVGFKRDPVFGPTVVVGLGGIWTEYLDTAAVHVGGLTPQAAKQLLAATPLARMISEARGGALCLDEVVSTMLAVSALGVGNPSIVSIDVNPLIVGRNHATAVDAVIEIKEQFPTEREK